MTKPRSRNKPTTSFTLDERHIAFLEETAAEHHSNRSWVLGRIIDLFMLAPKNITSKNLTTATADEQAA